ncbi:MAG TPA: DUF3078 domain-containing protein [Chitinophagaceae bacterium]|nr:DUF3078 domain-containing protein [Chitinophagaceae bacterium]
MRYWIFLFFTAMIATHSSAQVVQDLKRVGAKKRIALDSNGWKRSGLLVININQSAQRDWGSGGENFQLGINTILNKAIHHRNGKYTFDTYFDFELGLVEASSFKQFRKTNDRCDLTLELEHSIGKKGHFNYGILGNFNSQVFRGVNYNNETHPKISDFMTPGKILLSLGIDYKWTDDHQYFSLFITPATIRWVTKLDDEFYNRKVFGVDSFHRVYTEVGAFLSVHYNNKISKTTGLISRLDLFSNYKRNPKNVDVLLNNVLTFAITKYFAGSLLFDLVYDDDVKKRTQLQEIIGLGLRLRL